MFHGCSPRYDGGPILSYSEDSSFITPCLDASADPLIDRALWGGSIEYAHIRARRNLVASQSTSRSGSRRSLVHTDGQSPETAADITRLQKRVAGLVPGDGSGVAVFGSLPVIEALKPLLPATTKHGHFNALRGINEYETCHTAIIVGREQPGCRDLEDLARGLFFEDDEPIRTATELEARKVRLAGCNVEMVSEFHPDPRVQAVLAQVREREIEQAMDRLRFINDDATPKTVILVSRVAIDVDISMAMRFDHLCDGGAPFTRAIGSSRVVRLADHEVLDDIDPAWRLKVDDRRRCPAPIRTCSQSLRPRRRCAGHPDQVLSGASHVRIPAPRRRQAQVRTAAASVDPPGRGGPPASLAGPLWRRTHRHKAYGADLKTVRVRLDESMRTSRANPNYQQCKEQSVERRL